MTVTIPTRPWSDVTATGPMDAAEFWPAAARGDAVLERLIGDHPQFGPAAEATRWFIDGEYLAGEYGYSCATREDLPAVALHFHALTLSDEALLFLLAHELMHVRMKHYLCGEATDTDDQLFDRLRSYATEPLVNDQLAAEGILKPAGAPFFVPRGQTVFGMDLAGLERAEVWEMMAGRMSREALARLAAQRNGLRTDSIWHSRSPLPDRALRFWAQRCGPWRTQWSHDHQQLCASR